MSLVNVNKKANNEQECLGTLLYEEVILPSDGHGKQFRAPPTMGIAETLKDFVLDVATSWDFTSIVPAHFEAPIDATPRDWLDAFAFLFGRESDNELPEEDFATLNQLEALLLNFGLKNRDL